MFWRTTEKHGNEKGLKEILTFVSCQSYNKTKREKFYVCTVLRGIMLLFQFQVDFIPYFNPMFHSAINIRIFQTNGLQLFIIAHPGYCFHEIPMVLRVWINIKIIRNVYFFTLLSILAKSNNLNSEGILFLRVISPIASLVSRIGWTLILLSVESGHIIALIF